MELSQGDNHQRLTGQALAEALIAEASSDMTERGTDTELALQGVRNWYQRQADVAEGAYNFIVARGLARRTVAAREQ